MPETTSTGPVESVNSAGKNYSDQIKVLAQSFLNDPEESTRAAIAIERLQQLPRPGSEAWKYSPVNRLYEALNLTHELPRSSTAEDLSDLLDLVDSARYPLAAMTALALHTVSRTKLSENQHLRIQSPGAGHHWQHIEVPDNTHATLTQSYLPTQGAAHITTVSLGSGATLDHATTGCHNSGTGWRLLSVNQQPNSNYNLHQVSFGGALERIDTHVRLLGSGASASLTGALLCGAEDRCDNQTVLEHAAPRCTSAARYHGVANHQGRLTFGGRIHILENGAGTDAKLHNPNLLLSDAAEINTKPELEIYNDDVACAHGATVGQIDDDAVFYLRSRGINRAASYALLLKGFVNEVLGGPDAEIAQQLTNERLDHWTA